MLKFDPQTYLTWKQAGIHHISIEFIASGCEWTSIKIHENTKLNEYIEITWTHQDIQIFAHPSNSKILDNAYITHTWNKWIMKSEEVLTRCGCGKSFWIKTGDPKIDKLRLLKSKLAKNKSTHH